MSKRVDRFGNVSERKDKRGRQPKAVKKDGTIDMRGGPRETRGGYRVAAGRRHTTWMSPKEYEAKYGMLPLDYMLRVMTAKKGVSAARKDEMAKAAAPYLHPRLSSVAIKQDDGDEMRSLDLTKLSDAELAQYKSIVAKAQVQLLPATLAISGGDIEDGGPHTLN